MKGGYLWISYGEFNSQSIKIFLKVLFIVELEILLFYLRDFRHKPPCYNRDERKEVEKRGVLTFTRTLMAEASQEKVHISSSASDRTFKKIFVD